MVIVASTVLKTEFGDFKVCYHETKNGSCTSFSQGKLNENTPIVRMHSACLFGETFHSLHCDCAHQLKNTMSQIHKNKHGVIIYSYQEGRGIGLKKKIQAMEIQLTKKCDTVEAFNKLGLKKSDYRKYDAEIQSLKDLELNKTIKTYSGNQDKIQQLRNAGYKVKILKEDSTHLSKLAKEERKTKEQKMNYCY
jgi:GTP cyclohydrolase II